MSMKEKQSGATLLVSLIMLVVLTLLVVSAIRLSNTNLRIAGNMQVQSEAGAAAQQAIEQVMSSDFTANPIAQSIDVDVSNDGTKDYTVAVAKPACNNSQPLANADLNASDPADEVCLGSGVPENTGMIGSSGGGTVTAWCYKQQWDVQADVTDGRTGAKMTQHQGVGVRVAAGTAC